MPLDTGIYQNVGNYKQVEAPDLAGSMAKGIGMANLVRQGQAQDQEMQAKARAQRVSAWGNAMDGLMSVKPEQRDSAYAQMRSQLIQDGHAKPEELPEQRDDSLLSNMYARWQQTPMYLEKQKTMAEIGKLKAEAKYKGERNPLTDQVNLMTMRDQFDQAKKDREMKQYSNMGGWELEQGATPTADDAKKFKAAVSSARGLLSNLNKYQNLVKTYGSEVGGKTAQRMDSLVRDIQLAAKNEDLYGLGVLTGPDLALLEEVVGSAPTGVVAKLNPFSGGKAENKAEQFREMLNARLNSKGKTYGFKPTQEWQSLAGGGRPAQGAGSMGPSQAYATPPPKHGTVEDGYVFMGGDPADKKNWKAR